MVIDIASLDLKDRPVLALENLDETPIAILGNAFNIEAHIAYNDMSSITFDLPAYANGQPTPGYDDVIGTRLIRINGWGVFILVNPETAGDGIREIKSCKAYSREYELTYKKMSLEENTYNLWNPVTPDSTILGIIKNEYLPYWNIGTVDTDLVGKYRTFSESNVNLYNFLKSTVQQKYGCIVDFDTINRRINVRSTQNHSTTEPVYISLDNLAKEIEREEDTENIFTCLDVNGADGVTIRGVNPTGTNKIYNLDYYTSVPFSSYGTLPSSYWWSKSIASGDGSTRNVTNRISTINYIHPETKSIRPKQGYSFCIFAWDSTGTYQGVWNGSAWITTSATWISTELEIGSLTGNYQHKIVLRKTSGGTISTSDCSNIIFTMNKAGHFSQEFIDKWNEWKRAFNSSQERYQVLTIERMLKTSEIVSAQANVDEVYGAELGALEAQRSVYLEVMARSASGSSAYEDADDHLNNGWYDESHVWHDGINTQIAAKEAQIATEQTRIGTLTTEKDALTAELVAINQSLAFSAFFTPSEVLLLKQYFKEDSIQDSSFVYAEAKNYTGTDETRDLTSSSTVQIVTSDCTVTDLTGGRKIISCAGGSVTVGSLTAELIRGTAEYDPTSHHCVLTAYLSFGILGTDSFPNGCLTAVVDGGSYSKTDSASTSTVNLGGGSGRMYFTRNTTEYEKYAVEWDLYEYGKECLEKLAYPSYSFSVDTANFLSIDEFESFKNALELGQKIYLDMGNGTVLQPIFIGFDIELEDPSSLKLEFGDKYCLSDSAFELADLLNQSVSMGKTVDVSKFGYNAFIDSGASTAVKDYMDAALDVSKQAVLSSTGVDIRWDESGMTFRKKNGAGYLPTQIKIINDNIVFTDDGWQTAKMAIGHFVDTNEGDSWGVVAPSVVGTLLAGENLVIESKKTASADGTPGGDQVAVFKVDADGAVLHNSKLDIVRSNTVAPGTTQTYTHILLDPDLGFGLGAYPVVNSGAWDTTNAKFWVDMNGNVRLNNSYIDLRRNNTGGTQTQIIIDPELGFGIGTNSIVTTSGGSRQWYTENTKLWIDTTGNLHIKGTLEAADGTFNGIVRASDFQYYTGSGYVSMLTTEGGVDKFKSDYLSLKGIEVRNSSEEVTFQVDSNGNVTVNGDITLGPGTRIAWGQVTNKPNDLAYTGDITDAIDDFEDTLAAVAFTGSYGSLTNTPTIPTLPSYIKETYIDSTSIYSPTIYADAFVAQPQTTSANGGSFILRNGAGTNVFGLTYAGQLNGNFIIFDAQDNADSGSFTLRSMLTAVEGRLSVNKELILTSGYTYGTLSNRPAGSYPGQVYFAIS